MPSTNGAVIADQIQMRQESGYFSDQRKKLVSLESKLG